MRLVGTSKGNERPLPPSCLFYILFHNKDAAAPSRWGICAKMALRREGPMPIRRLSQQLRHDRKLVESEISLLIQTGLITRTAEDEVRIGWDRIVTELDLRHDFWRVPDFSIYLPIQVQKLHQFECQLSDEFLLSIHQPRPRRAERYSGNVRDWLFPRALE